MSALRCIAWDEPAYYVASLGRSWRGIMVVGRSLGRKARSMVRRKGLPGCAVCGRVCDQTPNSLSRTGARAFNIPDAPANPGRHAPCTSPPDSSLLNQEGKLLLGQRAL